MDSQEAWFTAARSGNVSVLASQAITCAGTVSASGRTALMLAAEKNHADACTILMDLEGGMVDKQGHTALFYAVQEGCRDACRALLQSEQELGAESSINLYSAAIGSKSIAVLRELLAVVPIDQGPGNVSVLAVAVSSSATEFVQALLDSGVMKIKDICSALCYVNESSVDIFSLLQEHLQRHHRNACQKEYKEQCLTELEDEICALTKLTINAGLVKMATRDSLTSVNAPRGSIDVAVGVMKKDGPPILSQSSYISTLKQTLREIEAKYTALKSTMDAVMKDVPDGHAQYESLMVDIWRAIHMQENHVSVAQAGALHVCEMCGVYEADFHKLRCENLQILHELVRIKKELYKKDKEILDLKNKSEASTNPVDGELDKIVTRVFDDIADFRGKLAHLKAVSLAKDEIIEEMRVELDKAKIGHFLYPNAITSVEQDRQDQCSSLTKSGQFAVITEPDAATFVAAKMPAPQGCHTEAVQTVDDSTQCDADTYSVPTINSAENATLEAKVKEQESIIRTLKLKMNTMLEAFNTTKHSLGEKAKKASTEAEKLSEELTRLARLLDLDSNAQEISLIGSQIAEQIVRLQFQIAEEKANNKRYSEILEQRTSDINYLVGKVNANVQRDGDLSAVIAKYELLADKIETTNQLVESLSREESPVICKATSPLRISRSLTPATNLPPNSPGETGGEEICSSPRGKHAITAEAEIEKLRETVSELTNLLVKKDEKITSLLESIALLQDELVTDNFSNKRTSKTSTAASAVANLSKSRLEAINSSKAEYQAVIRTLTEDRDNLREQLRLTAAENKELQIMNFSLQNSLSRTKTILEKSSVLAESLAGSNSPKRSETRISRSPLHDATMRNDVERVKQLIMHVGEVDERGNTSLMAASRLGYYEIAAILVSHESRYKNQFGDTALMFAAVSGHDAIVELLSPYEATIQNESGLTALMLAAEAGHIGCVQLLIRYEVRLVNKQHETALVLAASNDRPECVRVLAEYESGHRCVSLDERSGAGETALMRACKCGAKECVEILIDWEHDIRDMFGNSAAHYASDPDILSYFD